jgi:hypothetical protein
MISSTAQQGFIPERRNAEAAVREAESIELDAWVVLEMLGQQVMIAQEPAADQKNEPCIQIEYDLSFWGGAIAVFTVDMIFVE